MSAAVYLSNAALAAALLFFVRTGDRLRGRVVALVAGLGTVSGVVLMFLAQSDESWRSAAFSGAVACVGAGIACCWLIAGVHDAGHGVWPTAVLTGVASCGLALAAGNSWVVPALLFWVCSSFAIAALVADGPGRVAVWLALFVSDACVVAGLIGNGLREETWALPDSLTGWPLVAVLAAAVVRCGALPWTGIWGVLGSNGVVALPLLTAGAFTAVTWALGDPVPWLGVGLVAFSILLAIWGLVRAELSGALVAAVPVGLALGVAVAEPAATIAAGVAAVIAVALVAFWPLAIGRGDAPRGLHISFAPPTIGFLALVGAAVATFDRAVEAERVADQVVNFLFSGLLPLGLAVSVALAARVAGAKGEGLELGTGDAPGPEARNVSIAAWALFAASVAMAIVPPEVLGLEDQPLTSVPARVLFGLAAVVGAGAAYLATRWGGVLVATDGRVGTEGREETDDIEETDEVESPVEDRPGVSFRTLVPTTEKRSGKVLAYVTVFLAVVVLASVGWFTVYGMRLGFL
jgi:hypothetical protein